jgi:hypothetical protein
MIKGSQICILFLEFIRNCQQKKEKSFKREWEKGSELHIVRKIRKMENDKLSDRLVTELIQIGRIRRFIWGIVYYDKIKITFFKVIDKRNTDANLQ